VPSAYFANVSDATTDNVIGDDDPGVDLNQVRLMVVQYNPATGNGELYICDPGEAAQLVATAAGPDGNVIAPGNWNIGRRSDGDNDRYFQEKIGGFGNVDRNLTTGEIAQLATGISPLVLLEEDCAGAWASRTARRRSSRT
jgi:hypothetical protein